MDDFQFSFDWQGNDLNARCHVEGDAPRQTFLVSVDAPALQDQFGRELAFTWIDQLIFTWDTPEDHLASAYMKAVNVGLIEYLDDNE